MHSKLGLHTQGFPKLTLIKIDKNKFYFSKIKKKYENENMNLFSTYEHIHVKIKWSEVARHSLSVLDSGSPEVRIVS